MPGSVWAWRWRSRTGRVVLFDSEGDILMSLGMLATIAEQAPANFYHFILDNEVYATTGGQPVPNAKHVDYAHDGARRGLSSGVQFHRTGCVQRASCRAF